MRFSPRLLPLILLLAGLTTLAWWWPNRPMAGDVPMPAARFNSVSFAPFRAWQSPLTDTFPTAAEAEADMALVAGGTRAIRSYASIEGDYDTAAMAQRHGLKMWLGIWLGTDRVRNAEEMAKGIAIANKYPDTVERVVVGNEVLLRRDLPPEELISDIDHVKASVKQQVTYADVWEFWQQYPEVAAHVDVVTIHILPYWEDDPTGIDGAMAHIRTIYRQMAALFPGKPIAIGETGWPSRGRWRKDAAPSRVNQAVFLRRFIALAAAEGFDYNLIEAFDQVWKYKSEGTVGANWGLWTADRAQKFPLSGPLSEDPDWPSHAAMTIALGLVLLTGAVFFGPRLTPRAQAGMAVLTAALGLALAYAWAETIPDLYDIHLKIAATANLAGQALLAILLTARAGRLLAGLPVPPPRTGLQATETVRGLFRLRLPGGRAWVFDDLTFLFLWTAAVMQALLVFDPRYRDFPLPVFAVPFVAVLARALLSDLPRAGGGWEEALAGGALAAGAIIGAIMEGPLNLPSLAWSAMALVLAGPPLLRLLPRRRTVAAPA